MYMSMRATNSEDVFAIHFIKHGYYIVQYRQIHTKTIVITLRSYFVQPKESRHAHAITRKN